MTEIDFSPDACDARLLRELTFVTEANECLNMQVWGVTPYDRRSFQAEPAQCGTQACLAGWAAVHAGLAAPSLLPIPEYGSAETYELVITQPGQELLLQDDRFGPYDTTIPRVLETDFTGIGSILFGLRTRADGVLLFTASHTLGSLWRTAEHLTEGRVSLPPHLAQQVVDFDTAQYERTHR